MSREMEIGLLIGQATKIFEDALKVAFDVNTKTAARTYNEITQVLKMLHQLVIQLRLAKCGKYSQFCTIFVGLLKIRTTNG